MYKTNGKKIKECNGSIKKKSTIFSLSHNFPKKLKSFQQKQSVNISTKKCKRILNKADIKHPIVKNLIKVSPVIAFTILLFLYPTINQLINLKNIDTRPINDHPIQEVLPSNEIVWDSKGNVVEHPTNTNELILSFSHLEKKLLADAKYFNSNIPYISNIDAVYEFDTLHKNFGKESILEIVIDVNGEKYSLQYINTSKELSIDFSINDTNTISSFIKYLQNCYPAGFSSINQMKEPIVKALNTDCFVGDTFNYVEMTGQKQYRIAIYRDSNNDNCLDKCTLYSAFQVTLDNLDLPSEKGLADYLTNKNTFFTQEDLNSNFTNIVSASSNAIQELNKLSSEEYANLLLNEYSSQDISELVK